MGCSRNNLRFPLRPRYYFPSGTAKQRRNEGATYGGTSRARPKEESTRNRPSTSVPLVNIVPSAAPPARASWGNAHSSVPPPLTLFIYISQGSKRAAAILFLDVSRAAPRVAPRSFAPGTTRACPPTLPRLGNTGVDEPRPNTSRTAAPHGPRRRWPTAPVASANSAGQGTRTRAQNPASSAHGPCEG